MNVKPLYIAIAALITISACQKKIMTGKVLPVKIDSSSITPVKIQSPPAKVEVPKEDDYVLRIEPVSFINSTMKKAKVILINNTKEDVLAGLPYYIEIYEHNTWIGLNLHKNIIFDAVGIPIKPFSERELEVNLKVWPIVHDYKPGRYRITKDIITSNKKRFQLSAEFSVSGADTNQVTKPYIVSGSKMESIDDSLSMTISPGVFKLPNFNMAKVTLTNKSSFLLTAGAKIQIEYYTGIGWEKIHFKGVGYNDLGVGYNDLAYGLKAHTKLEMDVSLKPLPYNYKPGKYRITKTLRLSDGRNIPVIAEFVIE